MSSINPEVWDILNFEEKQSLSLSLSYNKSTWEAGEIMNKAHYKYLEINARAKKFMKMFTEMYEKHDRLLPDKGIAFDHDIPWDFIHYIKCVMVRRLKTKEAYNELHKYGYLKAGTRDHRIISALEIIQNSKDEFLMDFYDMVMEFDRWNNFRILPKDIQEPSAFKRRNKSRDAKHLKNITNLNDYAIDKIIAKYTYTGSKKIFLTCIISESFKDKDYQLIAVRDTPKNFKEITKLGLFIFKEEETVVDFATLVGGFINKESKSCKDGQKFWPKFRILMNKASNYKDINNISPSRRYFDNAYRDLDIIKEKRALNKARKKKKKFHAEKRSNDSSHHG